MNLKMIKSKTQENIINTIKQLVSANVNVQAHYDLEKETITLLLIEETKQNEMLDRMIVYNCGYDINAQSLTVTGFARRYG
jgi:ADP-dependent phosphofructokinase/glucokinase